MIARYSVRVLSAAGWAAGVAAALTLSGCSTAHETSPARSATEELLISTAADRAAGKLDLKIPEGSKVFVDATNFEGTDGKYAVAAIREKILKLGGRPVADRKDADTVIEIRSGALSIDEHEILVGIPKTNIPIPLAGSFGFPEIALFKIGERQGVAEFAAADYDAKGRKEADWTGPQFGYSHQKRWVVLLFVSWKTDDSIPKDQQDTN